MSLSKLQQKIFAIAGCYLSDLTLMAWLYFKATNFHNYGKVAASSIDSPDFQIQLYKVLLQSLTFFLLVFTVAQTFVYILAWRNFRAAYFYLKFFAVLGFSAFLLVTFTNSLFALLPAVIYVGGYYVFARSFKELKPALPSDIKPLSPESL